MSVGVNLQDGRDPVALVKVIQSGSFTVPRTKTITSPTSDYLVKSLDTIRQTIGGQIFAAVNDAAGGELGATPFPNIELQPGDVVACSAVASNVITVTVNSVTVFRITSVTTFGCVLLMYA